MKFANLRFVFVLNLLNQSTDKERHLLDYLTNKENLDFSYRKQNNYFYRFYQKQDKLIIGKIVKKTTIKPILNKETLEEEEVESFHQQAYVIFNIEKDIKKDINAQTCYVEFKRDFCGDPLALIKDLFSEITNRSGVDIEVNPIVKDENEFWIFVEKNKIKSLSLEIQPPNIFNHKLPLMEEAKNAQEKFKAQKIKKSMDTKEEDGLDLVSNKTDLEEDIKHCQNGGGIIKALARDGSDYKTNDCKNIKITSVSIPLEATKDSSDFFTKIFEMFK